jgi:hypothetical protein
MPDAMKKYAVNTSILVSKRMLDGGILAANDFSLHLASAASERYLSSFGLTKRHSIQTLILCPIGAQMD